MDGFTGFKTAAARKNFRRAVPVLDPFHVIRLAGDASMRHAAGFNRPPPPPRPQRRPALRCPPPSTGSDLLTDRQCARLGVVRRRGSMSKWRRHGASTSG